METPLASPSDIGHEFGRADTQRGGVACLLPQILPREGLSRKARTLTGCSGMYLCNAMSLSPHIIGFLWA